MVTELKVQKSKTLKFQVYIAYYFKTAKVKRKFF